jgi:antitoxin MazE
MIETGNIKKWGNSAGIRIPHTIIKAAQLEMDMPVHIHYEDGKIIIEPIHALPQDLSTLLTAITVDNLHQEIATGTPQGAEVW